MQLVWRKVLEDFVKVFFAHFATFGSLMATICFPILGRYLVIFNEPTSKKSSKLLTVDMKREEKDELSRKKMSRH